MAYIGSSPTKVVSRQSANIFTYTATANQTAFTGADANGNTLACTPSDIMVHMNGLRLEESDFTATTTTVTLGSGAAAGDEVTITAFVTFETADAYTKSASDTRYVNTAGDSMTGNLTTTGNVGIGGDPVKDFHVRDDNSFGGGSRIVAALSPSITNGQDAGLAFGTYSPDDYWKQGIFWERTGSYGLGHLHFANRGTADSTTVSKADAKMTINANGSVTKPSQPAFFAWNSTTFTGTGIVPFNNTTYNIGNHYSTSTGRFTAPVAGVYLFHVICTSGSSQNATYQYLGKNGSRHRDLFEGDAYVTNSERNASAILSLSANDVIDFRNGGSFSVQGNGNGNYYSAFMGVLLG